MLIVLVLTAVLAGLALGAGVVFYFARRTADESEAERAAAVQAAVDAAVTTALAERNATAQATAQSLQLDRAATVDAAMSRASEAAMQALDSRAKRQDERLDATGKAIDRRFTDVNKQMESIAALVHEMQQERARQHGEVVTSLEQAMKVTAALQNTTGSLREALASPKARGQWGERTAEDVLRAAGFVEGINFRKQTGIDTGGIPDFTFLLPKGQELHMDVKFPIDNYLRFLEAGDDAAAADRHRVAFRKDVRAKIKELAERGYTDPDESLDYVLLFIPNESVFTFINDDDPELIDKAMEQKVVLCAPSTLFANLTTIRKAMDSFMMERKGDEILECLVGFRKQWSLFGEQIDKVEKHLGTLQNSVGDLSGTRRNVLERELRRIDELEAQREVGADPDQDWPPLREVDAEAG